MKVLDTNVLIRYLVADDPAQTRLATKIIEDAARHRQQIFLPLLVVCETVWVLDRRYGQQRQEIADGVTVTFDRDLRACPGFEVLQLRSSKNDHRTAIVTSLVSFRLHVSCTGTAGPGAMPLGTRTLT